MLEMRPWTGARPPEVCNAIRTAAEVYSLSPRVVLFGTSWAAAHARRQVIHKLRSQGMSVTRIGRYLGGIHHTTVTHHLSIPPDPPPVVPVFVPKSWLRTLEEDSGHWAI